VIQVLTPVSYLLDTGRRKKRVEHINTLKFFVPCPEEQVKKVTLVLEDDDFVDCTDIAETNEKVGLEMIPLTKTKLSDRDDGLRDFADIMTDVPGTVHSV